MKFCGGVAVIVGTCSLLGGCGVSVPDKPGPTAKDEAIAYYRSVMAMVGPCDARGAAVSAASRSGDVIGLYQAVEEMQSACLSASVKEIEVPASVGKTVYAKLTKAAEICDRAYVNKWSASKSLKEALSDRNSIAALAALRSETSSAAIQTLGCVSELMGGVMQAGATAGELR